MLIFFISFFQAIFSFFPAVLSIAIFKRYLEIQKKDCEFPEGGYEGEYIYDIANNLSNDFGDSLIDNETIFKNTAEKHIFNDIKKTLDRINISFDYFFNENTLYENKDIYTVIDRLRDKGLIYDKDNATWFYGTKIGRENDRVCTACHEYSFELKDDVYMNRFDCCYKCYVKFVENREKRWFNLSDRVEILGAYYSRRSFNGNNI